MSTQPVQSRKTLLPVQTSPAPEIAELMRQSNWGSSRAGVLAVDEWPPSSEYFEDGRAPTYLLVREAKIEELQPDGSVKRIPNDSGKWNLPYDLLRPSETFEEAALRTVLEKSGHWFKLDDICHAGRCCNDGDPHTIIIYSAQTPGSKLVATPNPTEIISVGWFSYDEICEMQTYNKLCVPELVMGAIEQYRKYEPTTTVTIYNPQVTS